MGRKIPAKKHRGVKDPLEQQARRLKSVQNKVNAPPRDPDEQPVPLSLLRLFGLPPPERASRPPRRRLPARPLALGAKHTAPIDALKQKLKTKTCKKNVKAKLRAPRLAADGDDGPVYERLPFGTACPAPPALRGVGAGGARGAGGAGGVKGAKGTGEEARLAAVAAYRALKAAARPSRRPKPPKPPSMK